MTMTVNALLVDDDPCDRQAVARIVLRDLGWAVAEASSVSEGRDLLASTRFDIAILDLALVDGWGSDLIDHCHGCPIVVITGHASELLAVELKKRGVADYVVKDVGLRFLRELPALLRRALHKPLPPGAADQAALRASLAQLPVLVWARRPNGTLAYVSPASRPLLGLDAQALLDDPDAWEAALPPAWRLRFAAAVAAALRGRAHAFDYPRELPGSGLRWLRDESRGVFDASGTLRLIAGCTREVTEERTRIDELTLRAEVAATFGQIDPVTGLWTRSSFAGLLRAASETASGRGAALVFCVVHFRPAGGPAPDALPAQRAEARAVLGALRRGDVAALLGSDDMAALLGDATRAEARRIAELVRMSLQHAGADAPRRARIGVLSVRGREPMAALDAAAVRLREPGDGPEIVELDAAAGQSRVAVADVYALEDHRHAGRAVRAPFAVSDLAAGVRCLDLQQTIAGVVRSAAGAGGDLWLDVPAAALSLLDTAFWRRIAQPVAGMLRLVVAADELTASRALVNRTRALLLSGLGIVLAAPDLGAASLELLATVRPEAVRIDIETLRRRTTGPWSGRRLLFVAERLGARVLAQGLETDADFELARDLGCQLGHGPLR